MKHIGILLIFLLVAAVGCRGRLYLIDAAKGEIIAKESVGFNFESSPVVVDNNIVVGSRTNNFYKVAIEPAEENEN